MDGFKCGLDLNILPLSSHTVREEGEKQDSALLILLLLLFHRQHQALSASVCLRELVWSAVGWITKAQGDKLTHTARGNLHSRLHNPESGIRFLSNDKRQAAFSGWKWGNSVSWAERWLLQLCSQCRQICVSLGLLLWVAGRRWWHLALLKWLYWSKPCLTRLLSVIKWLGLWWGENSGCHLPGL